MRDWVALLRGINVGSGRKLQMAELKTMMADLGWTDIRHYIQSGNIVFRCDRPDPERLRDAIAAARGFRPDVLLLTGDAFEAVARANPFPDAVTSPKMLHVFFLGGAPEPGAQDRLAQAKGPEDRVHLAGRAMYLYTPRLLSGSAIAPRAERLLGVPATARNWSTVEKIRAMLDAGA